MAGRLVIDGRNFLDRDAVQRGGLHRTRASGAEAGRWGADCRR